MGILLCEQNFRDVWIRNKSVRAEIGQILHTDTHPHTHTTAAKLVVRVYVEARASIRTRSVCDPTLSNWGFGGAVSPPAGPGLSPGSKRIFGNNLLKIG